MHYFRLCCFTAILLNFREYLFGSNLYLQISDSLTQDNCAFQPTRFFEFLSLKSGNGMSKLFRFDASLRRSWR